MKIQFTKEETLKGQQVYKETLIIRDMQFRKIMYHHQTNRNLEAVMSHVGGHVGCKCPCTLLVKV